MQVLHETFADDPDVMVLAVHTSKRGDPAAYLEEHGYSFPAVADGRDIAAAYGIEKLPTFVLVGADGTVQDAYVGKLTDAVRDRLAESARSARP